MACRVCGGPTFGPICARCKGEQWCQPSMGVDHARRREAHQAMLSVLRQVAQDPCAGDGASAIPSCQCLPCRARLALAYYERIE